MCVCALFFSLSLRLSLSLSLPPPSLSVSRLSQVSGVGEITPGIAMNYDSDAYIQHLSTLLNKILEPHNTTILEFADKHFASVLGFPSLFRDNDGYIGGGNISAGGGQHMSCRQIAKVGQLILNKGKWPAPRSSSSTPHHAGTPQRSAAATPPGSGPKPEPFQLVNASYIEEMQTPHYPNAATTYGLLTWLNRRGQYPSFCCAPRWCRDSGSTNRWDGFSGTSLYGLIGDDIAYSHGPSALFNKTTGEPMLGPVIQAPEDVLMAYGWLARVMIVLPSRNMVVVSMGQTGGKSLLGGGCSYDEGYTISLIYSAFDKLLEENKTLADLAVSEQIPRIVVPEDGTPSGHKQRRHRAASDPDSSASARLQGGGGAGVGAEVGADAEMGTAAVPASSASSSGSCFCYCPPGEGYGHCFDLPPSTATSPSAATSPDNGDGGGGGGGGGMSTSVGGGAGEALSGDQQCTQYQSKAPDFCPSTGLVRQCGGPVSTCTDPSKDDWSAQGMNCSVVEPCPSAAAAVGEGGSHPHPFDSMICQCRPVKFDCYFQPGDSCDASRVLNPHFRRPVGSKFSSKVPRF